MNPRNRRAYLHPVTAFVLLGALLLPGAVAAQSAAGTVAAQQELRIQELESQISALTGQVEQLSYQVRQLTDKLDRMASDFDFRLTQLEGGGQGDGAGPAADGTSGSPDYSAAAPATTPAAPAQTASTAGSDGVAASTPGTGPKVLGTLTQTEYDAQAAKQQNSTAAAQQAMDATNTQTGADQTAAVAPGGLPGATADEQYQYAFGLLRENRYDDAEKALRTFISENPDHQLTGNANYWLGETHYVRGDYKNAAITFAQGVKNYPQSGKAPDNMMKLGMALAAMNQVPDACTAFAEVGKRYPQASDTLKDRVIKEQQRNGCR
ncbi:MAG: tol-pal system protein YbgF [Dongiaceae bacterium]